MKTNHSTLPTSMNSEVKRFCRRGEHNPLASHPKDKSWHLYPKLWPKLFNSEKESNHHVSLLSNSSNMFSTSFVLDSGSSAHMVSDKSLFDSLDRSKKGSVNTSCGSNKLSIEGCGNVKLNTSHGSFTLNDVQIVPNLAVNLISQQKFILDHCHVTLEMNQFSVSRLNKVIFSGHYNNNLPIINAQP